MKLQPSNEKWFNKKVLTDLLASLEEVSNRWSNSIFTGVKLLAAMSSLVVLIASMIIGTQLFIGYFGTGTFIFTLIVSSFAMSVFINFSGKQDTEDKGNLGTK